MARAGPGRERAPRLGAGLAEGAGGAPKGWGFQRLARKVRTELEVGAEPSLESGLPVTGVRTEEASSGWLGRRAGPQAHRKGAGRPAKSRDSIAPGLGCGNWVGGVSGPDRALLCPRRELAPAHREPRALHHAPAAPLPARAALLEKAGQARRLQRARQRAERHALSAKVVQRQNRARESRSRRPKHQGSFVYQPCQRQFNY